MPMIREIILKYKMRRATPEEEQNGYMTKITNPEAAVNALQEIAESGIEVFSCLFLNSKNRVLAKQTVETGTVNQANPILREIFRYALACDAASVVCCHNHPSGDTEPSREDREFTKTLVNAGNILNAKVLDHIIVAKDMETGAVKHFSFSEHSLL
jgi:DNA repair protein RadC